jgi:hypothetical protein
MSARDVLIQEIQRQPEEVLSQLLDYLKFLSEKHRSSGTPASANGWPASYFNLFGAFADEPWERPPQLPEEARKNW